MTSPRAITFVKLATLSLAAGLLFVHFHWFGNTTETYRYSTSAFRWMLFMWQSARIFGGTINWVGWMTPVITLALLLHRAPTLARIPHRIWWPGLAVVILGIALHWAGARAQQTRLSLLALILLLWAIPLFLYGWQVARRLAFPIGLLVFCVPLNFLDAFTFPMRLVAMQLAVLVLNGFGIPVERAGSMMLKPGDSAYGFDGSDPASGLGIVLLLTALGCVAVSFSRMAWYRNLLLLAAIPIAIVLGNAGRFVALALLAEAAGSETADRVYRAGSHALVMGFAILWLVAIAWALHRVRKPEVADTRPRTGLQQRPYGG